MAWAKNGTPHTLTGAGDTITISDLTAKKFNVFLSHILQSGAIWTDMRFNNNSNTVYAQRRSTNGGADGTMTSQNLLTQTSWGGSADAFIVNYLCSISGQEKLAIEFAVSQNTSGAGTAPERNELVAKFVPSPDTDVTRVDIVQGSSGDYATGSNLTAIGTD